MTSTKKYIYNMFKDEDRFKKFSAKEGIDYTLDENNEPVFTDPNDKLLYEEYKQLLFGHNTAGLGLNCTFPLSPETRERLDFRRKYVSLLAELHKQNIIDNFEEGNKKCDFDSIHGVSNNATLRKLPQMDNNKHLIDVTIPLDNNLRNEMLKAPKHLIQIPDVIIEKDGSITTVSYLIGTVQNKNVLFRMVETKTFKTNRKTKKANAASCIKIAAVCRNTKKGYVDLFRADYQAQEDHPNKFNDGGYATKLKNGKILKNAKTHFHFSTLEHDIIFPKSTSPDIIPADKDYQSYEDLRNDVKQQFNINDKTPIFDESKFPDQASKDKALDTSLNRMYDYYLHPEKYQNKNTEQKEQNKSWLNKNF